MKRIKTAIALTVVIAATSFSASRVSAQSHSRSTTIIINNGDTVINGKHLDKLSATEKEALLKESGLKDGGLLLGGTGIVLGGEGRRPNRVRPGSGSMFFNGDSSQVLRFFGNGDNNQAFSFNGDSVFFKRMNLDSLFAGSGIRIDSLFGDIPGFRGQIWGDGPRAFFRRGSPGDIAGNGFGVNGDRGTAGRFSNRKNSQSYSYSNTDKNGISTRVNFEVSDVDKEEAEKLGKSATNTLEFTDFSLVPSFSSGKTTLSFELPKGVTDVKLLDADYKPIFSEKLISFNGSFSKPFVLSKNGVYYLSVSQGTKSVLKRIVKQN